MIKVKFKNLGNIKNGEVEIKNFTILAGQNNMGKTYVSYALYSLFDKDFNYNLKEIKPIVKELYKKGFYNLNLKKFFDTNYQNMKKEVETAFSKNLFSIFSAKQDEFSKSEMTFTLDEEKIKKSLINTVHKSTFAIGKDKNIILEGIKEKNSIDLSLVLLSSSFPEDIIEEQLKILLSRFLFNSLFSNSFLLPAERTGLNIFYQELSSERTAMFHHFGKDEINKGELIRDLIISSYPQPIADYIDFLNKTFRNKKLNSEFRDLAVKIHTKILNGKYSVEKDGIYFFPYKNGANKDNYNKKISLHLSSSTVKTFFSLVFYLEHLAKIGDTLIIDEPELNLHPDNQRKIARILAMISNRGIKVIVSTHSDYFIRELNNLIMLKEDFISKQEIMQKYGYSESMLISDKNINAYLFQNNGISKMEVDSKEGIIAKTFDNVINILNLSTDEIFFQKEADLEEENAESN